MISDAEVRRWAVAWGVDAMVVNLDYCLGWFVAALTVSNRPGALRFKGGTCLRKCYFHDYRFSEDLDFTATERFDEARIHRWMARAVEWSARHDGPSFEAAPQRVETISDQYGGETYQVRVYYRGPLRYAGSPSAIRLDVTWNEVLVDQPAIRALIHPYSDQGTLDEASGISCYTLVEILTEKLRAVGGQRRFAVSRDLYDIHRLVLAGVDVSSVITLIPRKFQARGLGVELMGVAQLEAHRAEYEEDWRRRLSHLVRGRAEFGQAWSTVLDVIREAEAHLGSSSVD